MEGAFQSLWGCGCFLLLGRRVTGGKKTATYLFNIRKRNYLPPKPIARKNQIIWAFVLKFIGIGVSDGNIVSRAYQERTSATFLGATGVSQPSPCGLVIPRLGISRQGLAVFSRLCFRQGGRRSLGACYGFEARCLSLCEMLFMTALFTIPSCAGEACR